MSQSGEGGGRRGPVPRVPGGRVDVHRKLKISVFFKAENLENKPRTSSYFMPYLIGPSSLPHSLSRDRSKK